MNKGNLRTIGASIASDGEKDIKDQLKLNFYKKKYNNN